MHLNPPFTLELSQYLHVAAPLGKASLLWPAETATDLQTPSVCI